jgi:hypothetical protein
VHGTTDRGLPLRGAFMFPRRSKRGQWWRVSTWVGAFAALVVVQYIAVSNWSFNPIGSDTNTGMWTSLVPVRGPALRALRLIQPLLLQPLKGAIDRTMAIRVSPPDTAFGRWLASANSVDGVRRWHLSFALLNSMMWVIVGVFLFLGGRTLIRRIRSRPEAAVHGVS